MKPSREQLESAYSVYEEYNSITAEFIEEGVEGLTTPQLYSAIFSALTATLAKLAVCCDVPKGAVVDGLAHAYDVHNWENEHDARQQ